MKKISILLIGVLVIGLIGCNKVENDTLNTYDSNINTNFYK